MANTNKVEVEIVAVDEASPKIEKLEKRIDGLEADEARIVVTADIKKLDRQLTDALAKMHKLEGDELTVHTRMVGTLEDDLIAAKKLFDQLDGQTGTVKITADTSDVDTALRNTSGQLDATTKSAESGRNALANMVGNSAQDLGQLGGIAGTTGVAIGQMAEYASDAALATGSLRGALSGMATVVGPIAAVSIALAGINDILGAMREGKAATQAFDDAQLKQFTDSLEKGNDVAESYNETLADTGEVLADTGQKAGPAWAQILPGVSEFTKALGLLGQFGENIQNILPVLNQAGISSKLWTDIVTSDEPIKAMDALRETLAKTNLTEEEQHTILIAARSAQDAYANSLVVTADKHKFYGDSAQTASEKQAIFNTQVDAYLNLLDRRHRASLPEITDANQRINALEAERQAEERYVNAAEAHTNKLAELNTAEDRIADARQRRANETARLAAQVAISLRDIAEAGNQIEGDALAKVLGTNDDRLDALTKVQGINAEMRDLAEWVKKLGRVPNIFDPNDIDAADFLQRFSGLRQEIQRQVSDAFGSGGEAAAIATANSFVNTLVRQTGLSEGQVRGLLGIPEDLSVMLKVAVDQSDLAKAQRMLDLLKTLPGADQVQIANIQLAMDAGTITPQEALKLIQTKLRGLGVVIPATIEVASTEAEVARIQTKVSQTPVIVPAVVQPTALDLSRLNAALGQLSVPLGGFSFNQTVVNPPGTPATTVANAITYGRRNGTARQE